MMETIETNWDLIKEIIRKEYSLSDISFNTWIKPLELYDVVEQTVTILIPSDQAHSLTYITNKFKSFFQITITEMFETTYDICFVLTNEIEQKEDSTQTKQLIHNNESNLNQKYKFNTFVVGSNNNLAHSACLAVAESPPGQVYNPLFIYGGPGLGKTHLIHSIGHYMLEQSPNKSVLYVTSEEFTNEVIESIRSGDRSSMSKFREKYRSVDMLIVDDVQFIIGKESTQEEFFHTFNTLYASGKQIVLTSDKPPKDMEILEERIRSRFQSGLIADVQAPDYETRVAILRKNTESFNRNIDDEVIKYIATNIKSNIRELEGALNKIIASSKLNNTELTLSLAESALKDIIHQKESIVTPELIIDVVAEQYDISPKDIISKSRNKKIAFPRQVVMYLCRELLDIPLIQIAESLNKKDHTTIRHGIAKVTEELEKQKDNNNEELRNKLNTICKKISPTE